MSNNEEFDYHFSYKNIGTEFIFNFHEVNKELLRDKDLINFNFLKLKKIAKQSLCPLPISYYYSYLSMNEYINPFKGLKLEHGLHSSNRVIMNNMINLSTNNGCLTILNKFFNTLIVFPNFKVFDKLNLYNNFILLARKRNHDHLIQFFIDLNLNDKIVLTSKVVKEEVINHLIEAEYYKLLPQPLDNFSLHFKFGNFYNSVSLATSLARGNFIGFETIYSSENMDISYKYAFLFLNTFKGLKLSGGYHKTNLFIDLLYKFNKQYSIFLNYKINDLSFKEDWKMIYHSKINKDHFFIGIDQNIHNFHILYALNFSSSLKLNFSLELNLLGLFMNDVNNIQKNKLINNFGISIKMHNDNPCVE